MTNKASTPLKILICGSQNFQMEGFVHQTLDSLNLVLNNANSYINQIYTSQMSGACTFARDWVAHKNEQLPADLKINVKDYTFSLGGDQNNSHLYDELDLPDFVLKNDEFFLNGKDKMLEMQVKIIVAFPNPDGILGAQTRNIARFAKLANIHVIDASEIMAQHLVKHLNKQDDIAKAQEEISEAKTTIEKVNVQPAPLGLNNRHRAKTLR